MSAPVHVRVLCKQKWLEGNNQATRGWPSKDPFQLFLLKVAHDNPL
jgi:hypothetical protein